MDDLARIRAFSLKALAVYSAGWSLLLILASLLFPLANQMVVGLLSVGMSSLTAALAWRGRYDSAAACLCAFGPALQPALLLALLAGHPWQMEGHMYFFAGLAALTLTCDWRPLLVATLLIAVHHLGLTWIAHDLLFNGQHGHLDRVLIHAVAVLVTFALLARTNAVLLRTFADRARADVDRVQAEQLAAEQRRRAEEAERDGERRRRDSLAAMAETLEGSILDIAASVSAAAVQLERSAENMTRFAADTGSQASDVAGSARRTAVEVAGLTERVSTLARAIEDAASTAEDQLRLSEAARRSSDSGSEAMRVLMERTGGINTLVAVIKKVAFQTDLLALNATVEAARAGEAGQGFAVVASEVKSLSETSRGATEEINQLIGAVGEGATEADRALAAAADSLGALAAAANQVGGTMRQQREEALAIERSASASAEAVETMVGRFEQVASDAGSAISLADEIRQAAGRLGAIAVDLERETRSRLEQLRAA
nr:methyl-accepting chemotaxis protein [uncultured Sphingomonas sp.]